SSTATTTTARTRRSPGPHPPNASPNGSTRLPPTARAARAIVRVDHAVPVRGLHADDVDDGVGPAPARHVLELLDDVRVLVEVDDVGRPGAVGRHLEPVVLAVDGDH